jgi:hypothetical protein
MTDTDLSSTRANPAHAARGGSCFADLDAARSAIELVRQMVAVALDDPELSPYGTCCAVVLDPALTPQSGASYRDALLLEEDFGTRERWQADHAAYAHAAARTAWMHGANGTDLFKVKPHLLREGDSLLRGATCLDGIVVAVSGFAACYDEAVGLAIAAWMRAIAMARLELALGRAVLIAGA